MPEIAATLVHTKSSTIPNTLKPTYRETLLAGYENEYASASEGYRYIDSQDSTEKHWRLENCRTGAFFYRNVETGQVRVGAHSCHLRFCPLCSNTRRLIIQNNVTDWLKIAKFPKMITFTLKHNSLALEEQLNRLYDSFRKIRRKALMKKRIGGGVWFFQIKKSKTDHLWHPHIHCLVSGSFIPRRELSKAWQKITGDSVVVDIRQVKNVEAASKEVSRYATKPCYLPSLDWIDSLNVMSVLEQRRICGTWGKCRKLRLTSPPEFEKSRWTRIASWRSVLETYTVDKNAKLILDAWRTGKELAGGIDMDHLFVDPETLALRARDGPESVDPQTYIDWKGAL